MIAAAIRNVLRDGKINRSDDAPDHPLGDYCYVASEAYYHMADEVALTPEVEHVTWEDETFEVHSTTHWYLRSADGSVIDLTAEQFQALPAEPGYAGSPKGFLTKEPSKRAERLIAAAHRKMFENQSSDSFRCRFRKNSYVSC